MLRQSHTSIPSPTGVQRLRFKKGDAYLYVALWLLPVAAVVLFILKQILPSPDRSTAEFVARINKPGFFSLYLFNIVFAILSSLYIYLGGKAVNRGSTIGGISFVVFGILALATSVLSISGTIFFVNACGGYTDCPM